MTPLRRTALMPRGTSLSPGFNTAFQRSGCARVLRKRAADVRTPANWLRKGCGLSIRRRKR
ncbi:MAG: hypothetical protein EAZ21_08710 [Betaproteobacteria bacterium]|nr:MAG: hypothetical protein EAZ21_08710 [Betaproteobacteria bacterium]